MTEPTDPVTPPPGWYPDPEFHDRYRWWYGDIWSPPIKDGSPDVPLYAPSGARVHVNRRLYAPPQANHRLEYLDPPLPTRFFPEEPDEEGTPSWRRRGRWLSLLAVLLFILAAILTYMILSSLRATQVTDIARNNETGLKDGTYTMISSDKQSNYDLCSYAGTAINTANLDHIHGIVVVGQGASDCETIASTEIQVEFTVNQGKADIVSVR